MSLPTYPIVGIPIQPNKPLPLRQEITAWANNHDNCYQVSLFLRALATVKARAVEDRFGFFQLAGIHSYPLVEWDGVKQPQNPTNDPPGYCSHNVVTFPTWHRPYMLLYEQVLYERMIELIEGWSNNRIIDQNEKNTWSDAASQFRLPYWDWARKQVSTGTYGIPQLCILDKVDIVKPGAKGVTEPFDNPLTGFTNPKKNGSGQNVPMGDQLMGPNAIADNRVDVQVHGQTTVKTLPWSKCIGTSRYGIREDRPQSAWKDGVNNWDYANAAMANPQWYDAQQGPLKSSSFADAVSRMFSPGYFNSWAPFASTLINNPTNPQNTSFMSLEYIHNVLHNAAGGPYFSQDQIPSKDPVGFSGLGLGHMADVPVAAFDPIFWLHHCNVDRLFAMWQVLNWDLWFDDKDSPNPDLSLLPFHYDRQRHSWNSTRTRDWRTLHYQYDDLKDMPAGKPTQAFRDSLRTRINTLYPSTSSIVHHTGYSLQPSSFNDYIINVVYDRYALDGRAYSILFYIGDPTQSFSASKSDPHFVGAVYTFSAPFVSADGRTTCDNCGKQQADKVLSKAQIPLTLPLIRRVESFRAGFSGIPATQLGLLDRDRVEGVLRFGLKWFFVAIGGVQVDASEFPNTEIAVLQGTGQHPVDDHIMPRYERYSLLEHATREHRLGYNHPFGPNDLIAND